MFIRRTVIAASLIAVPIAFAASAQAAPAACSDGYFGAGQHKDICGVPNMSESMNNAKTNLKENFNIGNAASNFKQAATHGVGTDDPAA